MREGLGKKRGVPVCPAQRATIVSRMDALWAGAEDHEGRWGDDPDAPRPTHWHWLLLALFLVPLVVGAMGKIGSPGQMNSLLLTIVCGVPSVAIGVAVSVLLEWRIRQRCPLRWRTFSRACGIFFGLVVFGLGAWGASASLRHDEPLAYGLGFFVAAGVLLLFCVAGFVVLARAVRRVMRLIRMLANGEMEFAPRDEAAQPEVLENDVWRCRVLAPAAPRVPTNAFVRTPPSSSPYRDDGLSGRRVVCTSEHPDYLLGACLRDEYARLVTFGVWGAAAAGWAFWVLLRW